ncbi:hypothetical protein N7457_001472, partial [Penicillium paradoxum]|uniref:uncharacterized protein n=1 Tax=Penicillium paradoxum TaxID=176176 RepID=UPI002548C2AB
MMSTPSSSARLPPTSPQVTASVVKFRCLYTHDLRRKSKRWHDGYLRYHKFNKRVMVYDDQGNFIGDHHWRSTDEVQDGDEMELDKGVLIEVTENMGTTETDITNLYEKKKSSQSSPQTRDPVSQAPRVSASAPFRSSGSSQSFRSLNDLLGIKRTPIGHLVSPYEERNLPQPTSIAQGPERAPKRQKISSVANRALAKDPPARHQVIDLTDSNQEAPAMPVRQRPTTFGKELSRPVVDATADTFPATRQQRPTVQSKQIQPQTPDHSSFSRVSPSISSEPTSSLPTPADLIRSITRGVQPARPASNKSRVGPVPMQLSKPPGPSSKTSLPALPQETETQMPQVILHVNEPSVNHEDQSKDAPRPLRQRRPDPLATSKGSRSVALRQPDRLSVPQAPVRVVTNYVQPIQSADHQAPANMAHSTGARPSPDVPPPTNMPPPSRPSSALPSGAPTTSLRMVSGKPRSKLMYSALLPGTPRTSSPVASNTPLSNPIHDSATETREQQYRPNAAPSDSLTAGEEFMPSTSTQFIFDEMIDGSGFKSPSAIRRSTERRPVDSPLRKSSSDPTALNARNARAGGSLHAANKENEPGEQGPWTLEALDLFDFWPSGRPKPT